MTGTGEDPLGFLLGAYSARPELSDLFTYQALLDVPRDTRRARLLQRAGERDRAEWEGRWGRAEDLSFEVLVPSGAYDVVPDGA